MAVSALSTIVALLSPAYIVQVFVLAVVGSKNVTENESGEIAFAIAESCDLFVE